ncbi:MAG: dihydroorotase, partial [Polaromonas sp.]|nr:dihydroorotase [Polaromonas sp.]
LPFAEAEVGATAVELLLSLAANWAQADGVGWLRALGAITHGPATVLGHSLGTLSASAGRLAEGGVADICVFDASAWWTPRPGELLSQGKHTPFVGTELPAVVRCTLVGGQVAYDATPAMATAAA